MSEAAFPPRFPQDLAQADDVRCSVDALFLAAFVDGMYELAVDLGAGCGVVGLGLLLRGTAARVEALELDAVQAEAAGVNARLFGLDERFAVRQGDVGDAPQPELAHQADLVVSNPPWRLLGAQRPPVSERRRQALYGTAGTLPLFAAAGAARLRRKGVCAMIVGAERLTDLLEALRTVELCPVCLRFVHPRPGREAVFALVAARYGVQGRLRVEAPLIVHGPTGKKYSDETLRFCPWLE